VVEGSIRTILLLTLILFFTGCSGKSDVGQAQGTVTVQIPVYDSMTNYSLKNVELFEIENLREVSGAFARFFYAPGSNDTQLTGGSPVAHFIKSGGFFIPADLISTQMASIYYHLQQLAALDTAVGAGGLNQWPRSVGLETRISENETGRKNNAFYDGYTDSMMFVPFTSMDLPIALNAGIIAHEHFHSLFFKLVIKTAIASKKIMTGATSIHSDEQSAELSATKSMLMNEVYLRGLNEGLADFWGWLYTSDTQFMKWSLPSFSKQRALEMEEAFIGKYMTPAKMDNAIEEALQISEQPRLALIDFSYHVGTPHARFLKQWVTLRSQSESISLAEAKLKMAQDVVSYLKLLSVKIAKLEDHEVLSSGDLFFYFINKMVDEKKMNLEQCQFAIAYLNYGIEKPQEISSCELKDNTLTLVKP